MTESTLLFYYLREIKALPSLLLNPCVTGNIPGHLPKDRYRFYVHAWVVESISRSGSEAWWTLTLSKSILSITFATKAGRNNESIRPEHK